MAGCCHLREDNGINSTGLPHSWTEGSERPASIRSQNPPDRAAPISRCSLSRGAPASHIAMGGVALPQSPTKPKCPPACGDLRVMGDTWGKGRRAIMAS